VILDNLKELKRNIYVLFTGYIYIKKYYLFLIRNVFKSNQHDMYATI